MRWWHYCAVLSLALLWNSPISAVYHRYPALEELHPEPLPVSECREVPLHGPEGFAVDSSGRVYTGLADGRIVRTTRAVEYGNTSLQFETVTRTGAEHPQCGSEAWEPWCGRPLGLEFDSSGRLVIADAVFGLLRLDPDTGHLEVLATHTSDSPIVFPNAVQIHPRTGKVYLTDSSSKFRRTHVLYELCEMRPQGRLLEYDPQTQHTRVLVSDLAFPNGLLLNGATDELLITSTSHAEVLGYSLATQTLRTAATGLLGLPDNLSWRSTNMLVGLGSARARPFSLLHALGPHPWLRNALAALIPRDWIVKLAPSVSLAAELDPSGKVLRYLQGPEFPYLSEVFEYRGLVLFGSFRNPFLGLCKNVAEKVRTQ